MIPVPGVQVPDGSLTQTSDGQRDPFRVLYHTDTELNSSHLVAFGTPSTFAIGVNFSTDQVIRAHDS